jgi:repressor LexA
MADFSQLTERQKQIYDFIRDHIDEKGYPPTVRNIGDAFKIKSPNGVMCHLKALEKKGLITRKEFSARAIMLSDHKPATGRHGVPLLGRVAAGTPIEATPENDRLNFEELFAGANHFALQVHGKSMIDDHIQDGDYVIIRKQETADNGERVVAMIENEVTLKRFYKDKEHIVLKPANSEMHPIVVDDKANAQVLGVLVGVMRRC